MVKEKYLLGMKGSSGFATRLFPAISGYRPQPGRNPARPPGGPDRSEVELIEIVSESMIRIRSSSVR